MPSVASDMYDRDTGAVLVAEISEEAFAVSVEELCDDSEDCCGEMLRLLGDCDPGSISLEMDSSVVVA